MPVLGQREWFLCQVECCRRCEVRDHVINRRQRFTAQGGFFLSFDREIHMRLCYDRRSAFRLSGCHRRLLGELCAEDRDIVQSGGTAAEQQGVLEETRWRRRIFALHSALLTEASTGGRSSE